MPAWSWSSSLLEIPQSLASVIRRHAAEVDRVVVAGGDGTINQAVQVLVELGLPLAIIPAGTANNLARTVGLPLDLEGATAVAAGSHRRPVDLGRVNGRWFFTTASIGLSVQITEELSPELKRRLGPVAYALAALKVLRRTPPVSRGCLLGEREPPHPHGADRGRQWSILRRGPRGGPGRND